MADRDAPLRLASESVKLIGSPQRITGLIAFENARDVSAKPTRLALRTAAPELARGGRLPQLKVKGTLPPGAALPLPVKLKLPPLTPPGVYQAELEAPDGRACKVEVQVLPQRRTRFLPGVLRVSGRAGSTLSLVVHVINQGNVAVEIPRHAALELHTGDRAWPQHVHAAARAAAHKGFAAVFDAFVRKLASEDPRPARVRVRAGSGPLEPGGGRQLELAIALPKRLKARRSYVSLLRLADASLHLTLHIESAHAS